MSDAAVPLEAQRLSATPARIALGALDIIADGAARNFVIQTKTGRFHGFVLREGKEVRGFVDRCPHAGFPLAQRLDEYLSPDGRFIACSWHGAVFERTSGICIGGPCVGKRLSPWPVQVVEGQIRTA